MWFHFVAPGGGSPQSSLALAEWSKQRGEIPSDWIEKKSLGLSLWANQRPVSAPFMEENRYICTFELKPLRSEAWRTHSRNPWKWIQSTGRRLRPYHDTFVRVLTKRFVRWCEALGRRPTVTDGRIHDVGRSWRRWDRYCRAKGLERFLGEELAFVSNVELGTGSRVGVWGWG